MKSNWTPSACCQIVVIAVIMINVNTYRIPKDLFEYYKWKHFLVVNINEQLCSLLKLSQIICCYRSFVKAVHFFLWCYGVNFVYIISHICTPKTKEDLIIIQNCQKSIPKPYYERKQRPRNITSLKESIGKWEIKIGKWEMEIKWKLWKYRKRQSL